MKKVLIQEEDASILDVLETALKMQDFQVHTVTNCNSNFLEIINRFRPHVILLDYKLNGQSCIDICKQIKEKYPHLPVIALSCNRNIHTEYNRNGFDDYIPKPFDIDLLYRILRKHVSATHDLPTDAS